MPREAIKINIDVSCSYCKQVMGRQTERVDAGRLKVTIEENPNLTPRCDKSPDRKHANLTPEQAKALGFTE